MSCWHYGLGTQILIISLEKPWSTWRTHGHLPGRLSVAASLTFLVLTRSRAEEKNPMRITLFLLSLRLEQHHPTHTDKHNRQFQRSLDNVGRPCLKKKKQHWKENKSKRKKQEEERREDRERDRKRRENTWKHITFHWIYPKYYHFYTFLEKIKPRQFSLFAHYAFETGLLILHVKHTSVLSHISYAP